jgi:hypothetical protein
MKKTLLALTLFGSSAVLAQGIDFELNRAVSGSYKCDLIFEVKNQTNLNITFGNADITLREQDGTIISRDTLLFSRIKSGNSVGANALAGDESCASIKSIQIVIIAVEVDGKLTTSGSVLNTVNSGRKSSRVSGIMVR